MIAKLWAQKIMLGTKSFSEVPRLLKEQVKKILIQNHQEQLIIE